MDSTGAVLMDSTDVLNPPHSVRGFPPTKQDCCIPSLTILKIRNISFQIYVHKMAAKAEEQNGESLIPLSQPV